MTLHLHQSFGEGLPYGDPPWYQGGWTSQYYNQSHVTFRYLPFPLPSPFLSFNFLQSTILSPSCLIRLVSLSLLPSFSCLSTLLLFLCPFPPSYLHPFSPLPSPSLIPFPLLSSSLLFSSELLFENLFLVK